MSDSKLLRVLRRQRLAALVDLAVGFLLVTGGTVTAFLVVTF